MGQHLAEQPRPPAGAIWFDLRHQTAVVIVEDRLRHGTEEGEGMDMTIHPGFRRRRWIGPDVAGMALRQIQREEVGLLLNAADPHDHFAEISLGVTRCVRQRNEYFAMPPTVLAEIVLDDGIATLEPMLVAKPLEDPLGGMPLLTRSLMILR